MLSIKKYKEKKVHNYRILEGIHHNLEEEEDNTIAVVDDAVYH